MYPIEEYLHLDARKIDSVLEPESIQTTITSPPYFNNKNYGGSQKQIGWGQAFDDYLDDLKLVFEKCHKATRSNGTLWVVVNTYRREGSLTILPLKVMDTLEDVGWIPQDVILWDKVKNLPYTRKGQFRDHFEYILFLSKQKDFKHHVDRIRELEGLKEWWIRYPERYHPKGRVPSNIWSIIIPNQGSWSNGNIQHLCPFPPRLVERMLQVSTDEGDLVLDPFAGSGVVLAQAKHMNRRFIGCDINKKYRTQFLKEVEPEVGTLWRKRSQELAELEKRQERFSEIILSLRKLKFAKVLIDRLKKKFGDNVVELAIVHSGKNKANGKFLLKVIFGTSSSKEMEKIRNHLKVVVSRAPLSKYGLNPSIRTEVVRNLDIPLRIKRNNYFAYIEGRFFDCSDVDDSESSTNGGKKGFPPILSDMRISLDEIQTMISERDFTSQTPTSCP